MLFIYKRWSCSVSFSLIYLFMYAFFFPFSKNHKFVCGQRRLYLFFASEYDNKHIYIYGTMTNRYAQRLYCNWSSIIWVACWCEQHESVCCSEKSKCVYGCHCHQYMSSLNAIITGFIIFYSCLKLCFGWFASLFVSLRWDRESVQSLLLNSLPRIALFCGLTHLILFVLVVSVICIWRRSFEHELFNVSAVNKRYLFCVKLEHELIRPQTTTLRERKTSIQTRKSFYYSLRCLLLWFV